MSYVEWAVDNKIIQGADEKFGSDEKITREEMAVLISNYAKAMGYEIPMIRQAINYKDFGQVSTWAMDAVKKMQRSGIIMKMVKRYRYDRISHAVVVQLNNMLFYTSQNMLYAIFRNKD